MITLAELVASKPVMAICLAIVIFSYAAAVIASIALPIASGNWGVCIALVPAVAVAGPSYYKAGKWFYNRTRD